MSRRKNTDQRRLQIVSGLRAVMAKKGYDGASIADVAEAAGLSPGLVHYHFASKLEILLAVIDHLAESHFAKLDRAEEEAADDALTDLDAFIDAHLATGKTADPDALACWIMLSTEAMRDERVRDRYGAVVLSLRDRAAAIIRRGVRQKIFSRRDIEGSAAAIVSAIEGYYVVAAVERSLIPRGSAAPALKRMVRGLLGQSVKARPV